MASIIRKLRLLPRAVLIGGALGSFIILAALIALFAVPLSTRQPPAAPGSISGMVTNEAGEPFQGVEVYARFFDSVKGSWASGGSTQTDTDGTYTIAGLRADTSYRVEFYAPGDVYAWQFFPGAAAISKAQDVTVRPGENTSDIDAVMQPGGSIGGVVTNEAGVPTEGITVSAWTYEPAEGDWLWAGETQSGQDGAYSIRGLNTGTYRVGFQDQRPGGGIYLPRFFAGVSLAEARDIKVVLGQKTPEIDAVMQRGGSISGRVTDEAGAPLEGFEVRVDYFNAASDSWESVGLTSTGPDGAYTAFGLSTGTYRVEFREGPGAYVPQWFPDAPTREHARDVRVTIGQNTPGINVVMQVSGSISGTVTADVDTLPNAIEVSAWIHDVARNTWRRASSAAVYRDGTYTITGLGTGTYRIEIHDADGVRFSQWFPDAPTRDEARDVRVTIGQNTPGINVVLRVGLDP